MKDLILIELSKESTQVERSLDMLQVIDASQGASYTIIDSATGLPPEGLVVIRKGDDLEIQIDQEVVARIEEFYDEEADATFNVDGSVTASEGMVISSTDISAVTDGVDGEVVWQASESDSVGISSWLGAGLAGVAMGGVALASNHSDSSDSSESHEGAATRGITVAAAAGPFISDVKVSVYDNNGLSIGDGKIDPETGLVIVSISNGYEGTILVSLEDTNDKDGVKGVDYVDETTGKPIDMDGSLRAMGEVNGSGEVYISVTPLTELAARVAGISEDNKVTEEQVKVNEKVGKLFGIDDITAPVTTVNDEDYSGADENGDISAAENYGNALAMLSGMDQASGGLSETLELVINGLVGGEGDAALTMNPDVVKIMNEGVEKFNESENGQKNPIDLPAITGLPTITGAAEGGINIDESTDASSNTNIVIKGAKVGDEVTIHWGDTPHTVVIAESDIADDDRVTIIMPKDIVNKIEGQIPVSYQIGEGKQSSTVTVNVDFTAPEIISGEIDNLIEENSGADQVVYTVKGSDTINNDDNTDISKDLVYSLKTDNTDDASLFTIDENTGEVRLIASPNFEAKESYNFTVVATDAAGNATEKSISLNIKDLDESAPNITSENTATTIDENSGAEQVVYTATATDTADVDDDTDTSKDLLYSLKADDANLFKIDATTGEVTLIANPDHETKADYNFTVIATDKAGNATEKEVSLDINDLDDMAPTITSADTANAIDENSGSNQVVYKAESTDTGDIFTGATIYSLKEGDDANLFSIDGTSGEVTLIANPDHEGKADYKFTVIATDESGNAAEKEITLDINDITDLLVVTVENVIAAITEDTATTATVVGKASSTNPDSSTITYKISDETNYLIDAETGAITLTEAGAKIVNEGGDLPDFTVDAKSANGDTGTSANINPADTTDVNDVLTVTVENVIAAITEDTATTATVVGKASSTNPDSSTITYKISDETNYLIDAETGAITLTEAGAKIVNEGNNLPDFFVDTTSTTGDTGTSANINPADTTLRTITISPVTGDNIINDQEQSSVEIKGTTTGIEEGQVVTVKVDGVIVGSATVDSAGAWSLPNIDLSYKEDGTNPVVTADVTDLAENPANDTQELGVDTEVTATVAVDSITADDVINAQEAGETIQVTGTVTGELALGDKVTFTVGDNEYSATVKADATWIVDVLGSDLAKDTDFTVTATGSDDAGNPISVTADSTHSVDTEVTAGVTVDNITSDDIINIAESGITNTVVTGTVTGDLAVGDKVNFTVNANDYEATVSTVTNAAGNLTWTVDVLTADLVEDQSFVATATGTDTSGNPISVQTTSDHTIDTDAVEATVTVDNITSDDIINIAESGITNTAVTGTVTGDLAVGDKVNFTVNANDYEATVSTVTNAAGNLTWTVDVLTADLVEDQSFVATATGSDDVGNPISVTANSAHTVDLITVAEITVDSITSDNVINAAESKSDITITGTVTGELVADDVVTTTINEKLYTGKVDSDGRTWTISGVSGTDLVADQAFTVTATGANTDEAGNPIIATADSTHTVDTTVDAKIIVDKITSDDVINASESNSDITITGAVSGDLKAGDIVTTEINGKTYSSTVDSDGTTWTISGVSGADLVADLAFTVTATGASTDEAGNPIIATVDSTHTIDTTAPTFSTVELGNSAAVDGDIVLTFSENVVAGTGDIILTGATGSPITIGVDDNTQVSINDKTVTIDPKGDLNAGTSYHVTFASGVFTDQAGNAHAEVTGESTINFTTASASRSMGFSNARVMSDTDAAADLATVTNTDIVVFDMVEGVSSDHSGRTFDPDTSYSIYVREDLNPDSHLLTADAKAGSDWGLWKDANNLGDDDKLFLVGDEEPQVLASDLWAGEWEDHSALNNDVADTILNIIPIDVLASQGVV